MGERQRAARRFRPRHQDPNGIGLMPPAAGRAPFDRFFANVAKLLSGAVLGQAIVILATPILTRLYDPHAFAMLQSFTSAMGILMVVVCLRYDQALTMAKPEDLSPLVSTALLILIVMSLVCSGVAYVFQDRLFGTLGADLPYLWLFSAAGVIVYTLTNSSGFILVRESRFSSVSTGRAIQGGLFVLLAFTLHGHGGVVTLTIADLLGRICVAAGLVFVVIRHTPGLKLFLPAGEYIRILKTYRAFPLLSLPGGILNALGGMTNTIWMLALFDPASAGAYALVERLLASPTALIVTAMAQVYQAELSPSSTAAARPLAPGFRRLLLMQLRLGIVPALGLALLAPTVFPIVFGPQWHQAAVFCQIMVPLQFASFVAGPFNMVLMLIRRQGLQFIWEILRFTLVTGVWIASAFLKAAPVHALMAVSAAVVIVYATHLTIVYFAVRHRDREMAAQGAFAASEG
jgi:O-antigen/teichoic acid export membrane protein